jgi:hypothetical protein
VARSLPLPLGKPVSARRFNLEKEIGMADLRS